MSSDGVQRPAWYSKGGFPHLLHGPDFQSDGNANYGQLRADQGGNAKGPPAGSDVHTRAGHGTWNGPAPMGGGRAVRAQLEEQRSLIATKNLPVNEPKTTYVGGLDMPMMGLRTNKVTSAAEIEAAVSAGYRLFDCSPSYANEAEVGKGLKRCARDELFLISKLPNDCHRQDAVRESCIKSLVALDCKALDLFLMEWPVAWLPGTEEADSSVTLSDTWAAMEKLVDEGLVKTIGVANCGVAQVEEIMTGCCIKPAVNQVELHPLLAERKMVGVLYRKGVQCVSLCPLAGREAELMDSPVVAGVAAEVSRSTTDVILKWNTQRGVPAIQSLHKEDKDSLTDLGSFFTWKLSGNQKAQMDGLDLHKRFVSVPWHTFDDPEKGGAVKPSTVL